LIEKINFSDPLHRFIFGGKSFSLDSPGSDNYYKSIDSVNEYKIDKHGFRLDLAASDILVAGCSVTFGLGVPEEATWGSFVGRSLNKSVASIALPGKSISWIVEQIFIYFRTYGHPEKVLCLFPNLGRVTVLTDETILSGGNPSSRNANGIHTIDTFSGYEDERQRPKYIKKPYNIYYTTTYENSVNLSIKSIRALERYCNAAGIEFIWSTWDVPFSSDLIDQLNTDKDFSFENYFSIYTNGLNCYRKKGKVNRDVMFNSELEYNLCIAQHKDIECSCEITCHSELLALYGPDNFYLGTDTLLGYEHAHPGIHLHAHYGEAFLKQLEK
jgi:hypothetical protein